MPRTIARSDDPAAVAITNWVTLAEAKKAAKTAFAKIAASGDLDAIGKHAEAGRNLDRELSIAAVALKPHLARGPIDHAGWRVSLDKTGQINRQRLSKTQASAMNRPGLVSAAAA